MDNLAAVLNNQGKYKETGAYVSLIVNQRPLLGTFINSQLKTLRRFHSLTIFDAKYS